MIVTIIAALVALVIGGAAGYFIFRYVIKGKYNEMIEAANKEAEVVKEKKLFGSEGEIPQQEGGTRKRSAAA